MRAMSAETAPQAEPVTGSFEIHIFVEPLDPTPAQAEASLAIDVAPAGTAVAAANAALFPLAALLGCGADEIVFTKNGATAIYCHETTDTAFELALLMALASTQ